ncbi:MAG: HlyD family efflux transporter periplasmic adaptor subunit [Erythrobacter sp.]|uniref:HlyD family efflux transporter periplasmic adaptor subunit n=1 Tax=Erythrobacter sp. TaxID=1042 RepID=UPI00261A0FA3|nr:HlyD family efflux transporter periplasmic adaptor subunit [Erythrobacter sp.]MDJ0979689.1 HlyD family efflux transporter periplasmic adaptor subunit [Erythrobacter sp.]
MRRTLVLAAALVAVLIAAYATSGFGLFSSEETELKLYGNVDIREVDMAFEVSGRIDGVAVDEGDRVREGDLLARIDPSQSRDQLAQAEARVAQARADLRRLETGNRAQDIRQAEARVASAQATLERAQADYARREGLIGEGAISRGVWDQTVAQLRQSEAQFAEANQALSLQREGARAEDIAAARAQVESALADRSSINTNLSDTQLTAPVDGTVITRAIEPGSLVQPGVTAFTIAIDRPLRVRAYVAETDLSKVAPGMSVTIRADGNPNEYSGTIGFISPRAEFTPKSVETEDLRTDLVYRLRIKVENPDGRLRQGQPVTVTVPSSSEPEQN